MRRNRDARRELLTSGERAVGWLLAFLPTLLTVGGLALLISAHGAARGVGIGLLILMAVPVSPLLRARVRRREARALGADPGAVMDQLDHTDASFTLRVYATACVVTRSRACSSGS